MAVRFQDQLGEALRAYQAGQFMYKAPDGFASNWRPADWLLCRNGHFIAVEAKQCRTAGWAWSDWTPQQRAAAALVERSGGHYWLVINWRGPAGTKTADTFTWAVPGWLALNIESAATRKSLTIDMAKKVPGVTVQWVPGQGWDVADFLAVGIGSDNMR